MLQPKPTAADARLAAIMEREKELSLVQSLCYSLLTVSNKPALLLWIKERIREVLDFEQLIICTTNNEEKEYRIFIHTDEKAMTELSRDTYQVNDGFFDTVLHSADPVTINPAKSKNAVILQKASAVGYREAIALPLHYQKDNPSVLIFLFKKTDMLGRQGLRLIKGLNFQLSITVTNILMLEGIAKMGNTPAVTTTTEQTNPAIKPQGLAAIIGNSPEIQKVKELVITVAPTSSGVLLLGESGTGKEVIANAIHDLSLQCHKPMIKVNCAAIPANLLESELFGHEKGAFTGAIVRKTGKFELAHNSTLFLDEIGELPLQLQTKLLRVLQENEFEPLGSNKTVKVNVRIIAATNRDLQQEVTEGRFRADLFYRLNVFPVTLPPLRSRKEDIPLLSTYFISGYCSVNNRKSPMITTKVLEAMTLYHWPGNLRELKHILERSILLAETGTITHMQFPEINTVMAHTEEAFEIKPLHEVEKDYIIKAIKLCNGRISGPNGAAVRLGLPHTTLISKMQKLGINKNLTYNKQ